MKRVLEDVRFAIRTLRKDRGFSLAVVATLALAIGSNTAVFSVVNAVLLRPLPYPDPDRLVVFQNTSSEGWREFSSPASFAVWREQTGPVQHVSACQFSLANVTGEGEPEQVTQGRVSADFFKLFGATLLAGRTFIESEDRPEGDRVAVLGYGFWQRRFGGDPGVVGQTISLDGETWAVIGVVGLQSLHPRLKSLHREELSARDLRRGGGSEDLVDPRDSTSALKPPGSLGGDAFPTPRCHPEPSRSTEISAVSAAGWCFRVG